MNKIISIRNVNNERVAVAVKLALDGQEVEVLSLVIGNLLPIHAQRLLKVAITVKETDSTHIHIAV